MQITEGRQIFLTADRFRLANLPCRTFLAARRMERCQVNACRSEPSENYQDYQD